MRSATALVALMALVVAGLATAAAGADVLVHWLWFETLGYGPVYRTMLLTRATLFGLGFAVAFLWLYGNWAAATRGAGPMVELPWSEELLRLGLSGRRWRRHRLRGPIVAVAAIGALVAGLAALRSWRLWLLAWYAVPYGRADPLFGHDLGFYLLRLPLLEGLQAAAMTLTLVALAGAALIHTTTGGVRVDGNRLALSGTARVHLSLLAAAALGIKALGYRLDALRLLYEPGGLFFGATYTDIHVRLPVLRTLFWIAVATALAALLLARSGRLLVPVAGLALLLATSLVAGGIVPVAVQRYLVAPNELAREAPYLARHMELTREAYDLGRVERRSFTPAESLDWPSVVPELATLANARLWDAGPLLTAFQQLQEIRVYYEFAGVDVDRYPLQEVPDSPAPLAASGRRAVMLAARELNADRLPSQAQTWVNRWLVYTHGYGVTMTPVSGLEPNGMPTLVIRDIPPISRGGPRIERPEIYFGERTHQPVIVGTAVPEFDYPRGDDAAQTTYEGAAGVPIGSVGRRLLFAWYFGEWSILLSDYIGPDSRLLMHRPIRERISTLAPFLYLDRDPYLAIVDGRLVWIQDAYTVSDRFPYALPTRLGRRPGGRRADGGAAAGPRLNYIRNSVKAVVDAYDGSVTLYAFDPGDPLLRTYQRIFPGLFRPADEMPAGIRAHLRYPEDLFSVQVEIYATYHMGDPRLFYNREDVWTIPNEMYAGTAIPMEPYYILMALPRPTGESQSPGAEASGEPEFVLMLPLTPANRDNLIAWIVGRSDPAHYGELVVYEFPKDRLIYGPMQIEARIDQDPVISQQLSLWDQRGSQVIRGNLLVIPVSRGVLYVEPVFLRATQRDLPELRRIIVANGPRVTMQPTLAAALAAALPGAPAEWIAGAPPAGPAAEAGPPGPPADLPDVGPWVQEALELYRLAQERLRAGDWAAYGESMDELGRLLERLAGAVPRRQAESP